jgi:hypothetical protein
MGRGYKNHGDLDWLQMQANRLLRVENWDINDLAKEIFTILARVREPPGTEAQFIRPDGTVINIDTSTFDFPFDIPDPPVIDPTGDPTNQCTSSAQNKVDRIAVPCKVLNLIASNPEGALGVQTYNCELYPFGVLSSIYPQWDVADPDNPGKSLVVKDVALQLQVDTDEVIPSGTWTIACRITVSTIVTTQCTLAGVPQPPTTTVSLSKVGNFIQVPVWL